MSNRVSFVIPCHPPHYHFVDDFIDSLHKFRMEEQADLILVLSNEEDRDKFFENPQSRADIPIGTIILPPEYRNTINKNIPSIKKFYAVYRLRKKYEYIIVIDAETIVKKNVDLYAICQKFFNDRILWGNQTTGQDPNIELIKNSCARWFSYHPERDRIKSDLYTWFNQPCFYETKWLEEFFRVSGMINHLNSLAWTDFEYYIYMYYLILYRGFRFEDIGVQNNVGVCEARNVLNTEGINPNFKPFMCSQAMEKKLDNENLFLLIHLDRK